MIALNCAHKNSVKRGKTVAGTQRHLCRDCGKTFADERKPSGPLGDMRADPNKVFLAIDLLTEGMGVRAVERISGLDRETILKAIMIVGEKCQQFHDQHVRNVAVSDVQIDELHASVGCKERNRHKTKLTGYVGDAWTFLATERNHKMILAFSTGRRTQETTDDCLVHLKVAAGTKFQVSTDGLATYKYAIPFMFRGDCDYGVIIKKFRADQNIERRYSPAVIESVEKRAQFGSPDFDRICSSHVKRLHLTARTSLRRFTRLAIGFSRSIDHHRAMVAIWVCAFNFRNVHSTIKTTPAQKAGITDRRWTIREMTEAV